MLTKCWWLRMQRFPHVQRFVLPSKLVLLRRYHSEHVLFLSESRVSASEFWPTLQTVCLTSTHRFSVMSCRACLDLHSLHTLTFPSWSCRWLLKTIILQVLMSQMGPYGLMHRQHLKEPNLLMFVVSYFKMKVLMWKSTQMSWNVLFIEQVRVSLEEFTGLYSITYKSLWMSVVFSL